MITWLIQKNLVGHQDYTVELMVECKRQGHNPIGFKAEPFGKHIPEISLAKPTIVYAATLPVRTCWEKNLYNPGVFFKEENFRYSKYIQKLGDRVLNSEATITTLREILENKDKYRDLYEEDGMFFVKPDKDLKEFTGAVVNVEKIEKWIDEIDKERMLLVRDTPAIVSRPYKINAEYRLFIIEKTIITASRYKKDGKLSPSKKVPIEVFEAASEAINIWTPHDVCVIDLCETGGEYYIVEFNCMNSSGFYESDISTIVSQVSEYAKRYTNC